MATFSRDIRAVGWLAGGVAHDFNNILQAILSNIELAGQFIGPEHVAHDFLNAALSAGQRGATLTVQLLTFAQQGCLKPEVVDVNRFIGGMADLLPTLLGPGITIAFKPKEDIPAAYVDPQGLETALLNIALNAKAAMPEGGAVTIEAGFRQLAEGLALADGLLAAGGYVEISLTDTGCGMSTEVLERAFFPFYSTRDFGEGCGLGLSAVYGFICQSGGWVDLKSEVGQGTTVRMLLPPCNEDQDGPQPL